MGWCHILGINKLTLRTYQSVTALQPRCDKPMQAYNSVSDFTHLLSKTGHEAEGEMTQWFLVFSFWTVVVWGYSTWLIKKTKHLTTTFQHVKLIQCKYTVASYSCDMCYLPHIPIPKQMSRSTLNDSLNDIYLHSQNSIADVAYVHLTQIFDQWIQGIRVGW